MAGTVVIQEINGPSGSQVYTTVTEVIYGAADMVDPLQKQTADYYPPPVPDEGGPNFAYWKSHCLDISGTFDDMRDFKAYFTDPAWTLGTGGTARIGNRDSGDVGVPDGSYEQATGTQGESGDDMATDHTFFSGQTSKTQLWSAVDDENQVQFDSSFYGSATKTKHIVTQVSIGPGGSGSRQTGGQVHFTWQQVD